MCIFLAWKLLVSSIAHYNETDISCIRLYCFKSITNSANVTYSEVDWLAKTEASMWSNNPKNVHFQPTPKKCTLPTNPPKMHTSNQPPKNAHFRSKDGKGGQQRNAKCTLGCQWRKLPNVWNAPTHTFPKLTAIRRQEIQNIFLESESNCSCRM